VLYRIVGYHAGIKIPTASAEVVVGEEGLTELTDDQADELAAAGMVVIEHSSPRSRSRGKDVAADMIGNAIDAATDAAIAEIVENEELARAIAEKHGFVPSKRELLDNTRKESSPW
jgi:hypothetical protein